jgi:hypothetical protein
VLSYFNSYFMLEMCDGFIGYTYLCIGLSSCVFGSANVILSRSRSSLYKNRHAPVSGQDSRLLWSLVTRKDMSGWASRPRRKWQRLFVQPLSSRNSACYQFDVAIGVHHWETHTLYLPKRAENAVPSLSGYVVSCFLGFTIIPLTLRI